MADQAQTVAAGLATAGTAAVSGGQRRLARSLTAFAIALLCGTSAWFAWHERQQELDQAAQLAQRRANALASEVERTLDLAKIAIAQTEALLRRAPPGAGLAGVLDEAAIIRGQLLDALALPFEVHLHDAEGRLVGGVAAASAAAAPHVHRVPANAAPADNWIVGDIVMEGVPPQRAVPLLRRAQANAHGVAWVSADLSHAALLARFGREQVPGAGAALFRVERDGNAVTLLARAPFAEADLGRRLRGPLHEALKRGPQGVFREVAQLDGAERIVGYRRLGGGAGDLAVAYGINTDVVLGEWRATLPFQAGITLSLSVLLLLGGWRLDRSLQDGAAGVQALTASEAHFRALADNLPDVLVRFDRQFRHVYANAGVRRATGLPPEAFIGKTNAEMGMPEANVKTWIAALQRVFDSGRSEPLEFSFAGPDGVRQWESMIVAEPGPDGRTETALVISRDITERRRAEEALRRSELRFRLASSHGQVWDWDIAATRLVFPEAFWHALGHDAPAPQDSLAMIETLMHVDDREPWRRATRDHLARHAPFDVSHRLRNAAGEYRWFRLQGQAVWDAAGRATYMAGTTFDITEQQRLEEAVYASEARLRQLLANSPAVIYTARAEGDFGATYYSANLGALLGHEAQDFLGDSGFWLNHVHPDDSSRVLAQLDRVHTDDGSVVLEYRFRHRDGRWRWMRDEVRLTRDAAGAPLELVGSWIDITERREAEGEVRRLNAELEQRVLERTDELARSESRYRAIFEAVPVAIGEEDWSGVKRLLQGLRAQGVTDGPAYLAAHPAFVQDCLRAVKLLRLNRKMIALHDAQGPDRAMTDLEAVYGSVDNLPQFVGELEALWAGQRSYSAKRSLPSLSGRPLSLMLTMALPPPDGDDSLALACLVDITEIDRLNAELDASMARLRRINRELETFSYSVSHDLKAPLRGIDGYSRLLLRDHEAQLNDEGRAFLSNIRQAAQQMAQLIDDLLAYSRLERRAQELGALNVAEVLRTVLVPYDSELRRQGVQVKLDIPADLRVIGDAQSLALALRNLLDNALKFSRDATPPQIEIGAIESGRVVTLSVRDNGIGFDMKFHDRIFDIFQRLHRAEDYAGTGVGLAIVRKAMERMGGRAWAESQPGQGATFHLQLQTAPRA